MLSRIPQTHHEVTPWISAVRLALSRGFSLVPLEMQRTPAADHNLIGYFAFREDDTQYCTIPLTTLGAHVLACGLSDDQSLRLTVNQYLYRIPELLCCPEVTGLTRTRWDYLGMVG